MQQGWVGTYGYGGNGRNEGGQLVAGYQIQQAQQLVGHDAQGNAITQGTGEFWLTQSQTWRFTDFTSYNRLALDYYDGWLHKGPAFDETEGSERIGLLGHMVGSLEAALVVDVGRTISMAKLMPLNRAVAITKVAGNTLGFIGAGFTLYENATDASGLSVGDVAKVALGVGMMFTPVGLVFGVTDLAIGLVTGVMLSDRVGAGIDQMLGARAYHPIRP